MWIGLTGVFLAIAASDRYRPREVLMMVLGMLALGVLGVHWWKVKEMTFGLLDSAGLGIGGRQTSEPGGFGRSGCRRG